MGNSATLQQLTDTFVQEQSTANTVQKTWVGVKERGWGAVLQGVVMPAGFHKTNKLYWAIWFFGRDTGELGRISLMRPLSSELAGNQILCYESSKR